MVRRKKAIIPGQKQNTKPIMEFKVSKQTNGAWACTRMPSKKYGKVSGLLDVQEVMDWIQAHDVNYGGDDSELGNDPEFDGEPTEPEEGGE